MPSLPSNAGYLSGSQYKREEEFNLRQYWSVLRRHINVILAAFLVSELLITLFVYTRTPLYTGISTIMIEPQMPELFEGKGERPDVGDRDSFYRTQYEILRSRTLAATVIRNLGLDKNPRFLKTTNSKSTPSWIGSIFSKPKRPVRSPADSGLILGVKPQIIDAYLQALTIRPDADTRLVMVVFSNPDPVLAARVANAHVQAFIRQIIDLGSQNGEAMQHFLEGKLDELEKRVESSEAALNDYRRRIGIVAFNPENKDKIMSDRIGDLNRALVRAEEERIAFQADVETINSNDYDSVPAVIASPLIQNLKIQSTQLEGRYANLREQATPDYPPVAQLAAQLRDVQNRLQQEIRRVVAGLNSRYQQSLQKENELRKDLDQEKAKAMSMKDQSLRDAVLARELETNQALYKSVLERINKLGMASEAQITNISVVDTAEVPLAPSSPRKKLSLVLGGFLGLLLGVVVAFVLEDSYNNLKTAEEVQSYLGLPTLATVLRLPGPNGNRLPLGSRLRLEWSGGGKAPLALANGNGELEPVPSLFAAASEAYRAIRTAVLLSRSERPPKTILFSSALAGEGKSVTAVNTAIAFGHMLDRILLIDADLRRPRCHEILHQSQQPGLTEVLAGLRNLEDAVRPTGVKGLFFLSAGMIPPNPSELLGSKKMNEILATLAPDFDHILLDSAPILPVSDSVILSTFVEGVVLVSGAHTQRQITRDACMRLHHVGSKVLGVVLNNVDPEDQRYYYYYAPSV